LRPEKILIADSGVVTVCGARRLQGPRATSPVCAAALKRRCGTRSNNFARAGLSAERNAPLPAARNGNAHADRHLFLRLYSSARCSRGPPPATFKGLRDWIDFHERHEYRAQSFDAGCPARASSVGHIVSRV
jgi:hypothetical protein